MDILMDIVMVHLKEAFASKDMITEDIGHDMLINNFGLVKAYNLRILKLDFVVDTI
jgi:hypothetical protein